MGLQQAIPDLENRSLGAQGEPTLGPALELAAGEWRAGNRDRELSLHLLFLTWYCGLEPSHLTGFDDASAIDLPALFQEVYQSVADGILDDVEAFYVVGLMASMTPWLLGEDVPTWEARVADFRSRFRVLSGGTLRAEDFAGRGAYGDYFAGQLAEVGGL